VSAWAVSLFFELAIVASASLLCALTFTHVVASLAAVTAFYTLSRTMAAMLAIGSNPVAAQDSVAFRFATTLLDVIAAVLPRLDRFTRTDWLVYHSGSWATLGPLAAQTLIYLALLTAAALFDLYRRNL
jgi:hypothetical protein